MVNGLPLDQFTAILLALHGMIMIGLNTTALGLPVFVAIQWALEKTERGKLDSHAFKNPFDITIRTLYTPVSGQIEPIDRPVNQRRILLYVGFAGVVLVLSVVVEVLSLYAVTGVALAQYHISGSTFSLDAAYNSVIAGVLLFAIALTTYGTRVVQYDVEYA